MASMTLEEELAMLKKEVEALKKQNEAQVSYEEDVDGESIDFQGEFQELIEKVKLDYENLSPITAVGIFALGALFGRSISSK